jgi:hypothetical protein
MAVPRIEGPLTMELHAEQFGSRALRPRLAGRLEGEGGLQAQEHRHQTEPHHLSVDYGPAMVMRREATFVKVTVTYNDAARLFHSYVIIFRLSKTLEPR